MIVKEIFSKLKDNSRTNCTFLEFQEFSRTKVIFKDFSRSVQTLDIVPSYEISRQNTAVVLFMSSFFHKH